MEVLVRLRRKNNLFCACVCHLGLETDVKLDRVILNYMNAKKRKEKHNQLIVKVITFRGIHGLLVLTNLVSPWPSFCAGFKI